MMQKTDINTIRSKLSAAQKIGVTVPVEFICPLTFDIMDHPMMTKTGVHYERSAIVALLQNGIDTCPVTHKPLSISGLVTDFALKERIDFWLWENEICSVPIVKYGDLDNEEPVLFFTTTTTTKGADKVVKSRNEEQQASVATTTKKLGPVRRFFSTTHYHQNRSNEKVKSKSAAAA